MPPVLSPLGGLHAHKRKKDLVIVDLEAINKKKPRYESRKMVVNQAQRVKIRLIKSINILG